MAFEMTCTVDFDDTHIMSINPEIEHGKRRGVDYPKAVSLSGHEREGRVFIEARFGCHGGRRRARNRAEIRRILGKVHEASIWKRIRDERMLRWDKE